MGNTYSSPQQNTVLDKIMTAGLITAKKEKIHQLEIQMECERARIQSEIDNIKAEITTEEARLVELEKQLCIEPK
jgi:hypothetical protein